MKKHSTNIWQYYPGEIPVELLPTIESPEDKKEKSLERFILIMAGALVFFLAFFVAPAYIAEKL